METRRKVIKIRRGHGEEMRGSGYRDEQRVMCSALLHKTRERCVLPVNDKPPMIAATSQINLELMKCQV